MDQDQLATSSIGLLNFALDSNNDDPSGAFISLLPDSRQVLLPIIPSFDPDTSNPPDADGMSPAAPGVTSISLAGNGGSTREDGGAVEAEAGLKLFLHDSTCHLPDPPAAALVMAAPVTAAPVTAAPRVAMAAADTAEKSWTMSGASQETVGKGAIAPSPAPRHDQLHQNNVRHPEPPFVFSSPPRVLSRVPRPMHQYANGDMVSVLGSAIKENFHISDVKKTNASRKASHRDAQSRIASALAADAAKTKPLPSSPSASIVVDALADCLRQQLFLKERTTSEEEEAFGDGVIVRGNLGRAIVALKAEDKRRREAEVRAILVDARRRSSRRIRSAMMSKVKEEREAPPPWDHLHLRSKWKAGNLVSL